MDRCDGCGCEMKHERSGGPRPSLLFVCDDCRTWGMKRLGRGPITALQVGIRAGGPAASV